MSRRPAVACVVAVLLACCSPVATRPERQTGSLKGSILNRGGEIVAGAVIVAAGADGRVRAVGYTEEGQYRLDLPPGVYHVTVSSVGYYSLRRRRVRVRAGRTATINFTLEATRRRAARGPSRRGARR